MMNIFRKYTVVVFVAASCCGCYLFSPLRNIERRLGNAYPSFLNDRFCLVSSRTEGIYGEAWTNQFVVFNAERNVNYAFVWNKNGTYRATRFHLERFPLLGERLAYNWFKFDNYESLLNAGFDIIIDMSDLCRENEDFCGIGVKIDNWAIDVRAPKREVRMRDFIPMLLQKDCEKVVSGEDFDSVGLIVLKAKSCPVL